MHALIIEQDAWIALMIEDVLSQAGYNTFDFAVSGEDALDLAARHCPDLITSDVRLGTSDAIETVRSICSRHPIPVVFVTESSREVHDRCPDLAVVQKPFGLHDLKEAIAKANCLPSAFSW